jgi:DNA-binding transcriptional regulator YiaG
LKRPKEHTPKERTALSVEQRLSQVEAKLVANEAHLAANEGRLAGLENLLRVRQSVVDAIDRLTSATRDSSPSSLRNRIYEEMRLNPTGKKPPRTPTDIEQLKKQKSISQKNAALELGVSARTIRTYLRDGKLAKARRGRVVADDELFVARYSEMHGRPRQ